MAMRLYLSSYRLGRRADLLRFAGAGTGRALLILNACDIYGTGRDRTRDRETRDLAALGYSVSELDLRRYFGRPSALHDALIDVDLIWAVGGGAFALATAMTASGFGGVLRQLWSTGGPVYAGYSAGACVAGPDLRGIELIDDPHDIPADYPDVPSTTLGLIPERIVPHWRSDHAGSPGAERAIAELERSNLAYLPLRDGEEHIVGIPADTRSRG